MVRSRLSAGRSRPVIDRWARLTATAMAAVTVGSLIVRRAARSAGQAANATAGRKAAEPSEPVMPPKQLLGQAATRLRQAGATVGGRVSAAARAAWRELVHADHGPRGGPEAPGAETTAAPAASANAPGPRGNADHPLEAP
jgi:hypothetical protein